ncbi:MAG: hypothetical protein ACK4VL_04115 [Chitinophagales bacterium]|jgi:uncharacterized protein (TIGR02145 family)
MINYYKQKFTASIFILGLLMLFSTQAQAQLFGGQIRPSTSVKCGANVSGTYKAFMCHNLGANTALDPFTYVVGNANGSGGTLGYLYQWGRQTDGHELRNSLTQAGPVTLPVAARFITNLGGTFDWRSPQNNNLWLDNSKTANDPCPAGYRVPTQAQWGGTFRGGTTSGAPGTATQNTWTWTGNGFTVGTDLYLPAAGYRYVITATLTNFGTNGCYWSSTVFGTNAHFLNFNSGNVNPGNNSYRGNGISVRCIAE